VVASVGADKKDLIGRGIGNLLGVAVASNIADAFGNIGQGILPIPLVFDIYRPGK
jgi:hypothetical protein